MTLTLQGILIGVAGTAAMDLWAVIAKHVVRLPTTHWGMVGRWFGHMPRGVFRHRPIAASAPVAHEHAIGWTAHYAIGVVYGIAYLLVMARIGAAPSLLSALVFAWLLLAFPWLVMQPALGVGAFASRAQRPWLMRLVSITMHTAFGLGLFAACVTLR